MCLEVVVQNDNILLTVDELASVTGGYWENLPQEGVDIKSISFNRAELKQGDLYISYNEKDWSVAQNEEPILNDIYAKGAVAIVVRKAADIVPSGPVLRVDNTRDALKKIGKATSKRTHAKKVLVTGSFGKTGFKTQLYHLLKQQITTNAVLNSANQNVPIWKALGGIRSNDVLAIIEVAVAAAGRGRRRSAWVLPDLCVITDIGLEHIKLHGGSLANVIHNKAEVAKGLKQGGVFIIPNRKGITSQLKSAIEQHGNYNILLFGGSDECNAQLLKKEFNNFGWKIKARIEDQVVEYSLPLLEDYAPLSSLSVLLAAYHLGGDLSRCTQEYSSYKQFSSSGNFYEIENKKGKFHLYDQSKRGEMDAFKSTLQLISRIKPKNSGKKIAIFSEFTDLNEADKSIINNDEFRLLFEKSGIDILYTAHYFTEHINVLSDRSIWVEHSFNIEDIIPNIISTINNNDIVFIRGTLKSGLSELVKAIVNGGSIINRYN